MADFKRSEASDPTALDLGEDAAVVEVRDDVAGFIFREDVNTNGTPTRARSYYTQADILQKSCAIGCLDHSCNPNTFIPSAIIKGVVIKLTKVVASTICTAVAA